MSIIKEFNSVKALKEESDKLHTSINPVISIEISR